MKDAILGLALGFAALFCTCAATEIFAPWIVVLGVFPYMLKPKKG